MRNPLCWDCKHRGPNRTCAAYPDGIPHKFSSGKEVHISPEEGDHGIQFEVDESLPEDERLFALKIVGMHRDALVRPDVMVEAGPAAARR
jgi:hypothetical protein